MKFFKNLFRKRKILVLPIDQFTLQEADEIAKELHVYIIRVSGRDSTIYSVDL